MSFTSIDKTLFYTSRDPKLDPRLGDILSLQPGSQCTHLAGYPDDEGIVNNGGRLGAKHGPDSIRKFLYRMTPPVSGEKLCEFFDIGNLDVSKLNLEQRHNTVKDTVLASLNDGHSWCSLGGGHDYGFPDGAALIEFAKSKNQRPLVINFDAHLDVRPLTEKINSGTPFYRLLDTYSDFDMLEIGIQSQCNSRTHLDWLKSKGGHVLFHDDILTSGDSADISILKFLEPWILKRRPTFLSLDIDAFKTSEAPGCSQSWPSGFSYHDLYKVFETLRMRLDIKVLGIYEVSPPLDTQDLTSKLAAQILYQFLRA